MKRARRYLSEHALIAATMLLSVLGFWRLYVGEDAAPDAYHHLHVLTVFAWLFLLLYQLRLVRGRRYDQHRKVGLAVLLLGPVLFASTALLSVHSAHEGVVSGEGDALIVQNVMNTLTLGLLIVLAFVLRRRRKLHGALVTSTAILFMGIALFFTLIAWVPQFRIEGPETFHRFAYAGMTGQAVCVVVGVLLSVRDVRNGWPYLLAGASFLANEGIRAALAANGLIEPLTALVGSMNQPATFVGAFAVLLASLLATGLRGARKRVGEAGGGSWNGEMESSALDRVS